MLPPHVVEQARRVLIRLTAVINFAYVHERGSRIVNDRVLFHVRGVREFAPALTALVRFRSGVLSHVSVEV